MDEPRHRCYLTFLHCFKQCCSSWVEPRSDFVAARYRMKIGPRRNEIEVAIWDALVSVRRKASSQEVNCIPAERGADDSRQSFTVRVWLYRVRQSVRPSASTAISICSIASSCPTITFVVRSDVGNCWDTHSDRIVLVFRVELVLVPRALYCSA